jgi:signal peptidase I
MLSTLVLLSIFLVLLIITFIIWVLCLRLGLRWAKSAVRSNRRIFVTAVISQIILPIVSMPLMFMSSQKSIVSIGISIVELVLLVLLPCLIIKGLFQLRFWRAFQAWLPTLLTGAFSWPIIFFVIRPYVAEAFVAPTNSMAPTILGYHWVGTCEICGSPNYCSPIDARYDLTSKGVATICRNHFHTASDQRLGGPLYNPDRFIVSKFLTPRRWDIIAFYYPENPTDIFIKRLVGLPGELVYIDNGTIWVNGKEIVPPDYLHEINYVSKFPDFHVELFGTKANPAQLSEDEYFVLGDFSLRAKDSRCWQQGAEGHHPYAVPESYILGVVTHIYWPPSRIRVLR